MSVTINETLYEPPCEAPVPSVTIAWAANGITPFAASGYLIGGPLTGRLKLVAPELLAQIQARGSREPEDALFVDVYRVDRETDAETLVGRYQVRPDAPGPDVLFSLGGRDMRPARAGETPHGQQRKIVNGASVVVPGSAFVYVRAERLRLAVRGFTDDAAACAAAYPAGSYEIKLDGAIK